MTNHSDRSGHHGHHHEAGGRVPGHKFEAHNWERLLSAERHALLDPERMLDRLGVHAGMAVADLGAGPGFFTLPLARRVGVTGSVFATDVSPEMIRVLSARGLPAQVHTILAEESGFDIPDDSVDLALLAFVLHELTHPAAFLGEVRRILRRHGRLAVLEWKPQEEPIGPPLHERLSEEASAAILAGAGFGVVDRDTPNASHYLLIVENAA